MVYDTDIHSLLHYIMERAPISTWYTVYEDDLVIAQCPTLEIAARIYVLFSGLYKDQTYRIEHPITKKGVVTIDPLSPDAPF